MVGLHDHGVRPCGRGRDLLGLGRVRRERLLAEHVLACAHRGEGPPSVKGGRQRHVHRVDAVVREKRLVVIVHVRDAVLRRIPSRPLRVARGDRGDLDTLDPARGCEERTLGDARGTQDADSKLHPHTVSRTAQVQAVERETPRRPWSRPPLSLCRLREYRRARRKEHHHDRLRRPARGAPGLRPRQAQCHRRLRRGLVQKELDAEREKDAEREEARAEKKAAAKKAAAAEAEEPEEGDEG